MLGGDRGRSGVMGLIRGGGDWGRLGAIGCDGGRSGAMGATGRGGGDEGLGDGPIGGDRILSVQNSNGENFY